MQQLREKILSSFKVEDLSQVGPRTLIISELESADELYRMRIFLQGLLYRFEELGQAISNDAQNMRHIMAVKDQCVIYECEGPTYVRDGDGYGYCEAHEHKLKQD